MTDTTRVQRWREAKRQAGLQAVTVWMSTSEELRLKDAAVLERCSASEVMQRAFAQYQARTPSSISPVPDTSLIQVLIQDALAQWQPPSSQSISTVPDTALIREMIRSELAAMHDLVSPTGHGAVPVTDTVSDTIADTTPRGQPAPRGYGVLSHQVREAIARQPEPFTPADIAAACGATSRDVWPYLKRGEQAGTLRREHAGKGAPYRRV